MSKSDKSHRKGKDRKKEAKATGPYDPSALAAIRWLAMAIEQEALSAYITDPECFLHIVKSLRQEVTALRKLCGKPMPDTEEHCPAGWLDCDGMCAPRCADEGANLTSKGRKAH